ncbi:MAG: S1 RNA-binding domain-containing protein, partial [Acidobacteria bacterium]|nr:S1 RNA-binding domain-containing protein [Acidobacteriota bacterium]MCA1608331.1 S1 RNA-binding domain-containing protein [Acidobacteriota bacterium]
RKQFHKGDEVEVQVLGVDAEEKRISLGMRQLQDNPWDTVAYRYPVGTKVQGKVRNLTDFGAFVEIEDGVDGLVHVSDITWAKNLRHPKELLKKDQEVEVVVTQIDPRGQRLSLSMKDLTPSAWESFVATHKPGDVVRGKISRFTSFGVFVELGEGLEGLCHISELSDERVERAEDVVKMSDEYDFKILRIENADQKIGLSKRAVGRVEEPAADSRVYSTEAKGGMASLGELANVARGGAGEQPAETGGVKETKEAKAERKARARREYEESLAAAKDAPADVPAEESAAEDAGENAGDSAESEAPAVETDSQPAPESNAEGAGEAEQPTTTEGDTPPVETVEETTKEETEQQTA